jgi:hypothetical protein
LEQISHICLKDVMSEEKRKNYFLSPDGVLQHG